MAAIRVNGHPADTINLMDRGFQYGDGVFTTLRVAAGAPLFLGHHLDRLRRDAGRLAIPAVGTGVLLEDIRLLLRNQPEGVLKIQITRGQGGRGYRLPDVVAPTRVVALHPPPLFPAGNRLDGVAVRYCRTRLGMNPDLAGIKHMNRLEQVLARAEWFSSAIAEGLMRDAEGYVVEGTMSNLFMVKQGQLFTPLLDRCGVSGVMRALLLAGAGELGLRVTETRLACAPLEGADELFLSNSVIGIWPVRRLEQQDFSVGPVTRELAAWLKTATQHAINAWRAG